MGKRDYVSEILAKKQRTVPTSQRWELVSERLNNIGLLSKVAHFIEYFDQIEGIEELEGFDSIEKDYEALKYSFGLSTELSRYIPIGLVACMEGYFRKVYADLIDHGSPYKENASKFSDIKFSIETAISLEIQAVSIGDFVAHLLTTNNLDDINRNISTLIGEDFIGKLKTIRGQAICQQYLFPVDDNELMGYMVKSIRRIFEFRHMFCHEIDPVVSMEEFRAIAGYPEAIVEFLWISEFLISDLLSG
ncbi:hypothetical protein [Chamaesiphon sp. VAR_69_metabat_338]|uniref:hypothetical protein n=1 Tax=Chamaesiphon sp. VAR_69_metabat_338 TaxID=2964704 RepID=UPI00286EAD7C|nr:hypothetical protein [Chamaesiphon sp. VAR_69_metabat_338]